MVIDAGHTPADYGAVSCTDHKEVDYNDELVIEISRELAARNIAFLLTRTIGCDTNHDDRLRQYLVDRLDDEKWKRYRELYSRIALANENHAALFISIHHDSVQEHHLSRTEDGKIIDVKDDFKKKIQSGVFDLYRLRSKIPRYRIKLSEIIEVCRDIVKENAGDGQKTLHLSRRNTGTG